MEVRSGRCPIGAGYDGDGMARMIQAPRGWLVGEAHTFIDPARSSAAWLHRRPCAREALLSVLAGDLHGTTPTWAALWLFKLIFCLHTVHSLRRTPYTRKMRGLRTRSETMPGVS
jgi:hypothetical protein